MSYVIAIDIMIAATLLEQSLFNQVMSYHLSEPNLHILNFGAQSIPGPVCTVRGIISLVQYVINVLKS